MDNFKFTILTLIILLDGVSKTNQKIQLRPKKRTDDSVTKEKYLLRNELIFFATKLEETEKQVHSLNKTDQFLLLDHNITSIKRKNKKIAKFMFQTSKEKI